MSDSFGFEFVPAKLKVRHESVVRALYADLPRQCTTCGIRFKTQEKHSDHVDWRVKRNRAAKKYKKKLSRNFFLTSCMWLDAAAEANGAPPGPAFFQSNTVENVKNCEELFAVVADENQKECPLCMEPFNECFRNETDDWMYKGAVYLNQANALRKKWYKSMLGLIVHAKCINSQVFTL